MVYKQKIDSVDAVGDLEEIGKEMVATEATEVRVRITSLAQ